MIIYLGVCCLKRPFDDHAQPRVRVEAEAALGLLEQDGELVTLIRSVAHHLENDQNPLAWRAGRVRAWLEGGSLADTPAATLQARTRELMTHGFRGFGALHLACAEVAGADVFVTCDDRLLALARRLGSTVRVRVGELTAVASEVLG
jgi:hypothetical protein